MVTGGWPDGGCGGALSAPPAASVGCGVAVAGEVGARTPTGPAEITLPNFIYDVYSMYNNSTSSSISSIEFGGSLGDCRWP